MKVLITIYTDFKKIYNVNILKNLNYDYFYDGINLKILIDIKSYKDLKTFYEIILLNVLKDSKLYWVFEMFLKRLNFKKLFLKIKNFNNVFYDLGNYNIKFERII